MGAASAIFGAERAVFSVVIERSQGIYALRIAVEPPIQQIEVVAGLVHQQRTAVFHFSVPTTKIIGAVLDVQIPVKICRGHFPYLSRAQQFPYFHAMGRIAVVKRNAADFFGSLFGIEDGLYLFLVSGHRFFGDDVGAQFHSPYDKIIVRRIHRTDDQHVGLGFLHHLFEIGIRGTGQAHIVLPGLHPAGIDIADAHELHIIRILVRHVASPSTCAAVSQPDHGETFLLYGVHRFGWRYSPRIGEKDGADIGARDLSPQGSTCQCCRRSQKTSARHFVVFIFHRHRYIRIILRSTTILFSPR